jgi:FkbM family methyltransferase
MFQLKNSLSPAHLVDCAISFAFSHGYTSIGEALLYHLKGSGSGQLIQWNGPAGLKLWLNPKNYIDRILLRNEKHDPEVIDALIEQARPGDVFWDVGANIGLIGFLMLERLPSLKVYAFEPSPLTFTQLFENNSANNNIQHLLQFALSSKEGLFPLSVKVNRNSSQNTFIPQDQYNYDTYIMALCQTGDSVVDRGIAPAPNILKIDVEGSEYNVFQGMKNALQQASLRAIVFEGPTPEQSQIEELLLKSGFTKPRALTNRGQTNYLTIRSQ